MPAGTLYVVGTPLGHLGDLSERVVRTLSEVAVVAAEDTRHSRRLLTAIGASPRRLLSYHAHSDRRREQLLLDILQEGEDVALITDAGTPAVSDPGVDIVAAAHAAGITVVPIPGPSAVATLLSAAGLPADHYLFLGFLPRKGRGRSELLAEIAASRRTVVMFEAANRLVALLNDLAEVGGEDRIAVVGRELTKAHEEVRRDTVAALGQHYAAVAPRGEVTIAVAGASPSAIAAAEVPAEAVHEAIREWLSAGESRSAVARKVADQFGIPRNVAYRMVVES